MARKRWVGVVLGGAAAAAAAAARADERRHPHNPQPTPQSTTPI